MPLVLLHGLGQTPSSWDAVARRLETEPLCPDLFAPLKGRAASYENLYQSFAAVCDGIPGPLQLCGLSLGGVLALQYCAGHPRRVDALVLIGAQYVMPKRLLKVQNAVFHLLPGRAFREMGLPKRDVITLTNSMADLDFREDLKRVSCPALVLCGERDRANRDAAQGLQAGLPNARFTLVPGAGHEVNIDAPDALACLLNEFCLPAGAPPER